MKSDVIRKRSRHDARRASITGPDDTPSTSSGPTSRRSSPVRDASPTLAPDSTTQLSYDFEDSDAFRSVSAPSSSELMGALGALTGAGPVNHVGDTTHRGLYQAPSSPYHPLSSALSSTSGISLFPGPYHPDYLLQFANVAGDALPFSSVDNAEIDATMSPRSNKRRRMSVDSAEEPPQSAVSFGSFSGPTGDNAYNSTVPSTSHGHSISHTVTRGHSHSFSLSHNHSHSLSSQTHSHSLSHSHGHAKRSSMEFPFTNYNANGTINSGPVLRGSGNTFWHPPMLPQTGSDNEGQLFHPHGSSSSSGNGNNGSNSNSNSNNNNAANESGVNGGNGSRTTGGGRNEDSTMDYLHPLPMLQDEDNLFSTFVHPPMVLPDEVGQSGDGNIHTSMYVDSSYYQ
jgi:GATA-binding protein